MYNYFNSYFKMKALRLFVCLLCVGMLAASCSNDENEARIETVTFEGEYWNSLIDNAQYGGPLLYGNLASAYRWIDEETHLSGGMTNAWGGDYGYTEGGIAISNYVSDDFEHHNDFTHQLEAPSTVGGKNFAMVYCATQDENLTTLSILDDKPHVIRSMQICPSTYVIGAAKYGTDFCKALTGKDDFLTLHITAENGASMQVNLVENGQIQTSWKEISLKELGAIRSLSFSMSGSDSSEWGLNTPTYFAIDNIVVEL